MTRAVSVPLVALALALAWPSSSSARRQPTPGGKMTVALPPELVEPTLQAHTHAPLVQPLAAPDAASLLAHPPLEGAPGWSSSVLADLTAEDEHRVWRLVPKPGMARAVAGSVERCLLAEDIDPPPWPSAVLRAVGVRPVVKSAGNDVLLAFERSVGPVPELLAGCLVYADGAGPTGAYAEVAPAVLAGRQGSPGGPPLIDVVELRPLGGHADLIAGSPTGPSSNTFLAPIPDVVLLLQSARARAQDPFGLAGEGGTAGFRSGLGAELLLAVYWEGLGRPAEGVLPPRIAPARPLPRTSPVDLPSPLALLPLPDKAPRLSIRVPPADVLLDGIRDRLAVLLRARGLGIRVLPDDGRPLVEGTELLRWRPDTTDPALALLSLAGSRPALKAALPEERLKDPRLLSVSFEERLEGALALERAWIEARAIVPLMTAERWFAVHPALRSVKIRPDGVPLLDDAYWGDAR